MTTVTKLPGWMFQAPKWVLEQEADERAAHRDADCKAIRALLKQMAAVKLTFWFQAGDRFANTYAVGVATTQTAADEYERQGYKTVTEHEAEHLLDGEGRASHDHVWLYLTVDGTGDERCRCWRCGEDFIWRLRCIAVSGSYKDDLGMRQQRDDSLPVLKMLDRWPWPCIAGDIANAT